MSSETEVLEQLGLTANEAKLYLLLVKNGAMKAQELSLKSGLQRRSVYDTLAQLEQKGMAGKAEVDGVLQFVPSPPSSLISLLDEKKDAIEGILPNLTKTFEAEKKTSVSVIYGKAGLKMMMEDVLELRANFCVYYGQLQIAEFLPKFFQLFNEKRKQLNIRARWLLLDLPVVRERAKKVPLVEFKYMDPSTISGGVWWTYADRLVLIVVKEKAEDTVVVFIKNADFAKTFQKTFDIIFGSQARIYHGTSGMEAILEMTLDSKETLFIGGSGQAPTRLADYFRRRYAQEAAKRGHIWRNVAQRQILKTPAVKLPFHNIRLFPKAWPSSPNVVWIFGDCVANVVWLTEPVAFLVEDRHVAKAYRDYFELLWKMADRK